MTRRRLAALAALVLAAGTLAFALALGARHFPNGLSVLACLAVAGVLAWYGVRRRGAARIAGLGGAALAIAGSFALVAVEGAVLEDLLLIGGAALTLAAAGTAFVIRVDLPRARRASRPVLFMNPRSGGGKATRFHLTDEARSRGIDTVELQQGDDLEALVRDAVAGGADALAMAGGDGSQAVVASVAAELDLPYACIPAGTRNHFALDLGVDRDDVVGALDALVDGGERRVDLAEVNGRVFVNNVSLGLYAEAVQQAGYRDAKIRTILETVPDVLGPNGRQLDLRWTDEGGGSHSTGATILVSNNRYRLGRLVGSGTRPRMDEHVLGVAVAGGGGGSQGPPLREWSAEEFEIRSDEPVPAGIDGEAVELTAPVRFRTRPNALRVCIARAHPGASPSAAMPTGLLDGIRSLARVAGNAEAEVPG